jgi:hypothetical protein
MQVLLSIIVNMIAFYIHYVKYSFCKTRQPQLMAVGN